MKKIFLSIFLLSFVTAQAQDINLELLKKVTQNIDTSSVKESPIPGLFSVQVDNQILYITADGTKIISGNIIDLEKKVNLTEQGKKGIIVKALAKTKEEDTIVYKALNEKYIVHVFTDISCPWCRKLHKAMSEYNDLGITIKYLAYPRAGVNSKTSRDMQSIWCATDRQEALDNAKLRDTVSSLSCDGTQVKEHFYLGNAIGVTGTPAIVLADGTVLGGFLPPENLLNELRKFR